MQIQMIIELPLFFILCTLTLFYRLLFDFFCFETFVIRGAHLIEEPTLSPLLLSVSVYRVVCALVTHHL